MAGKRGYHHGDLRQALLRATLELVRERGARGFSVSETARRAGVSISAPYRHFADRDAMLAAAALAGFRDLENRFAQLPAIQTFGDRTAQIAVAYLRFAQEDPARFEVMFAGGFDKSQHDDLMRQANRIQERLEAALEPYFTGRRSSVAGRAAELWSLAHGVATLAVQGGLGHAISDRRFDQVAESAARAWSAGVDGCS